MWRKKEKHTGKVGWQVKPSQVTFPSLQVLIRSRHCAAHVGEAHGGEAMSRLHTESVQRMQDSTAGGPGKREMCVQEGWDTLPGEL